MKVAISKEYNESDDYFYLDLNLDFEDEEDDRLINTINRYFRDLSDGLRGHFEIQENLYKLINDKYLDRRYNPEEHYFYYGDSGFKRFIRDINERELRTLTEIYTDLILEKVEYTNEMYRLRHREAVKTSLKKDTEAIELSKINLKEPTYMVADNKCYTVEFKEVEGDNSIDGIKEEIYNTIYDDLHSQVQSIKSTYERKIEGLKQKFQVERDDLFVEILKNSAGILQDWEFTELSGELYLKYKSEIRTDKIMYHNHLYDYGEEFDKLYVQGLKVKIKKFIGDNEVRVTRGKNMHFNGSTGCIGDLNGKRLFEVLKELPDALRIGNMDSPLNDEVSSYIRHTFIPTIRDNNGDIRTERAIEEDWSL